MLSIKHILAPVDFSERSEAAAAEAAKLAELTRAELTLLHVGATVQVGKTYRSAKEIAEREKTQLESSRHLEDQVKALAARVAPQASAVLAEGDAAACIEEHVKNHGVDLVVIATHGRGRFRRYLLGSLTSKLLHDLSVPVATGAHLEEQPVFPASLNNVGCALNLRDPDDAERILRWAGDLAGTVGAQLTVINVPHAADRSQLFSAEADHAAKVDAENQIHELLNKTGLTAEVKVAIGDPMQDVIDLMEEAACGALVIGRTARTGPFRVGHADGYALIRHSHVPVFSV